MFTTVECLPVCVDMNKLHVVILSDFGYVNGGNAAVALASARGLARRGHSVTVLSAVGAGTRTTDLDGVRSVSSGQEEIRTDSNRIRAILQGMWNFKAARMLRALLRDLDPARTVVHLHSWTQALSSSVVRTALAIGVPVVYTMHDYFSLCPNGTFFNHQTNEICRLRPMSLSCMASHCDKRSYVHKVWRVLRQAVQANLGGVPNQIRDVIAVSPFSHAILTPGLPPGARVHHIPSPIEVSRDVPARVAANTTFVMVGKITKGKGTLLFAKAARALGCDALFVGDGPCAQEVLQICPGARVTGWVSREQVTQYLKASRVLVFPSLWYETEGLSVIEAAALGVPAIVSDTSAARLSIAEGVTGLCFAGADETDLTRAMRTIAADDALVGRMGQAAHDRYWQHPRTLERHVSELEAVYEQVLRRQR